MASYEMTDESKTHTNQKKSWFLKLPPEIHNAIHNFVCMDGLIIVPQCPRTSYQGAFGLLHTCRQIRFEALPIFYHRATFYLKTQKDNTVQSKTDPTTGKCVKSIKMAFEFMASLCSRPHVARIKPIQATRELGKLMPNLEHVHVDLGASTPSQRMRLNYEKAFRLHSSIQHVTFHYRSSEREVNRSLQRIRTQAEVWGFR